MMDLKGKRALITGGTRGIGAAIALDLARQGAHVAINGRHDDQTARKLAESITALGVTGELVIADVAQPDQVATLVARSADALGGLDILIHAAGGPLPGRVEEVAPDDWMRAFDVHVHAAYHLCRFGLPHLRLNDEGVVILVSSAAGVRGCPNAVGYGTAKGAVLQMTRMLARDLADDSIRVNCVAPGIIRTRFHEKMTREQQEHNVTHRIPLHREGTGDDVAQVVRLLVTNQFMTGEVVVVDGGMSMQIVR